MSDLWTRQEAWQSHPIHDVSVSLCQIFGPGKKLGSLILFTMCLCLCVRSLDRARSLAVSSYSRCVCVSVSDLWTRQEAWQSHPIHDVSVSDLWTGQEAWQSYSIHDVSVSLCQIFGPGKKLGSLILFTMCLCLCVRSLDRARSLVVSSYSRCVFVSMSDLWTRQEAWQSYPIHDVSVSLCQIFGPGKKLGSLILFTMCLCVRSLDRARSLVVSSYSRCVFVSMSDLWTGQELGSLILFTMCLSLCQIFGTGKKLGSLILFTMCLCVCVRSLDRARSFGNLILFTMCLCLCVRSLDRARSLAVSSYSRCVCVSVSDLWTGQEAWQSHPIHDVSVSLCQIFGPGKKLGSLILFTMCLCLCVRSLDRARSLAVSSYSRCVCVSVSDLWTGQEAWQSHPIHDVSVSLCQIFGPGKKLGSLILFTMCLCLCVRSLDRARSLAVSSYSRCVCVSVSDLWTGQEAWQSHPIHDVSVSLCQIFGPGKKLGSLILFTMCLCLCVRSLDQARSLVVSSYSRCVCVSVSDLWTGQEAWQSHPIHDVSVSLCQIFGPGKKLGSLILFTMCLCLCVRSLDRARSLAVSSYSRCVCVSLCQIFGPGKKLDSLILFTMCLCLCVRSLDRARSWAVSSYSRCVCVSVSDLWTRQEAWQSHPIHDESLCLCQIFGPGKKLGSLILFTMCLCLCVRSLDRARSLAVSSYSRCVCVSLCQIFGPGKKLGSLILFTMCLCLCVRSLDQARSLAVSSYSRCVCVSVSDLWTRQEAWQSHPIHDVSLCLCQIFGPGKKLGSLILFTMCLLIITSCVSLQLFCSIKDFHKFETFPQVSYFFMTFPRCFFHNFIYVLMVCDMTPERSF